MAPTSRRHGVKTQRVGEELIVYDLESCRVHRLNRTTALIWRHCDGRATIADLAKLVAEKTGLPANKHLVWMALDQLDRARLLRDRLARSPDERRFSRRQVLALGFAGAASLLLPGCESVTAPTATGGGTSLGTLAQVPPGPPPPPPPAKFCVGEVVDVKAEGKRVCPVTVKDKICLKCEPKPQDKKKPDPPVECPVGKAPKAPLAGATMTFDPPTLQIYEAGACKLVFRSGKKLCAIKVVAETEECGDCPAGAKKQGTDFDIC
jgi:coenzyme PQQ synthesis protein D (PqqD)